MNVPLGHFDGNVELPVAIKYIGSGNENVCNANAPKLLDGEEELLRSQKEELGRNGW